MKDGAPLIVPGDYNIDYNQKLNLLRFEKYGHWDIIWEYGSKCIFFITLLVIFYFSIRFLKSHFIYMEKSNQLKLKDKWMKTIEKKVEDFLYIVKRLEEERMLMGTSEYDLKKRYYADLFDIYLEIYAWDSMFTARYPQLIPYFSDMRKMLNSYAK